MLRLFASTSLSTLADKLADDVAAPGGDPFDPVMVCVPTVGMRRWVSQQLSQRLGARPGATDGIEANVNLPFPATITGAIRAAVRTPAGASAPDASAAVDPWGLHRLVWPVAGVLAEARATDASPLAGVATLAPGATITGQAWRVAHLLDRYVTHRPDMVAAWLAGNDVGPDEQPLDSPHVWQATLARQVANRIDDRCPALDITDDLRRVAAGELTVDLPPSFSLFGVSALTPHLTRALNALGHVHDINVHLGVASTRWWQDIGEACIGDGPVIDGASVWSMTRDSLRTQPVDLAHHPLLRWAQPSGDTAALLALAGSEPTALAGGSEPGLPPANTLLGRLQADIRANRHPDGTLPWRPDDDSLRIHRCTGATRQVEVLRDAICHLMAADPSLTEADILICTPNVHRFSGLVRSVFAASSAPTLNVRVTERMAGGDNPVLDAVVRLLDLGDSRCTATEVAELLSNEAVARRFDLTEDDLELLGTVAEDTNIKWGLDAHHRNRWGLPDTFVTNTWQAGWEQALWGVVLAPSDGDPDGAPPALDLPPGDMAGIARLTRALRHVGGAVQSLARPRPATEWVEDLSGMVDAMTTPAADARWQRTRVDDALDRLATDATVSAPPGSTTIEAIDLASLRRLLTEYWPPDTRSVAFGTGAITMASLQSGRSLPHRVVCLLGLDHRDLTGAPNDGDDLTATAPGFGDHDHTTEQRQRLIELLLAAGDAVVITCDGTDPVKNADIPLPVELAEVVDAVVATVSGEPGTQPGTAVVVRHPRQPFDPRLFQPDPLDAGPTDELAPLPHAPWGFDTAHLTAARILAGHAGADADTRHDAADQPASPTETNGPIDLDLLRRFTHDPVKTFYRHTLNLVLPDDGELTDDNLQLTLDGLETFHLGEELIGRLARRDDADAGAICESWTNQQRARGALPPGRLGDDAAGQITTEARAIAAIAAAAGRTPDTTMTIDVAIGLDGWDVVGAVATRGGAVRGPTLATMSTFGDHLLRKVWVDLLALVADDPLTPWQAMVVARPSREDRSKGRPPEVRTVVIPGDDPDIRHHTATHTLEALVEVMELGLQQALPLSPRDTTDLAKGVNPWGNWNTPSAYLCQAFGDVTAHGLPDHPIAGRTAWEWNQYLLDLWEASTEVVEPDVDPTVGMAP